MDINSNIASVRGVGENTAKKLNYLGIKTIRDLINYYPRKYEDFSVVDSVSNIKPGNIIIKAKINNVRSIRSPRGLYITEAIASDKTGSVRLVWFNQPYRARSIDVSAEYYISGKYSLTRNKFVISSPYLEPISSFSSGAAKILSIYKETKGLKSSQIRKIVKQVSDIIDKLPETLPKWIVEDNQLMPLSRATANIHMPASTLDLEKANRRLGFEEIFNLSLASLINKKENKSEQSIMIKYNEDLAVKFSRSLPFKLTDDQRKTVMRTYIDMEKQNPMNRLVEGDVGSGKTVVAVMASLMALAENKQIAFMAPTETLARQHAETIYGLLKLLGLENNVTLLVGSLSPKEKSNAHAAIKSGKAKFIIGTHALISEKVNMQNLALVVIDEQHRFGVDQRKKLMAKAGHMPHVLSLSATPIPRSLALTLYGEMDISILKTKPKNRIPIKTAVYSLNQREQVYRDARKLLDEGNQMYIIAPKITEDEEDHSSATVEGVYKQITGSYLKGRKVGLLHGKLKTQEKQHLLEDFKRKKLDVLVSTTVIEVGIDIPNANIMVIESADSFGLAQLHQLRGRIGRGDKQAYCYLINYSENIDNKRLRALETSDSGFELAELDLEIRGPGAIYGKSQHGELDLKIAKLSDKALINSARNAAKQFIEKNEELSKYPSLQTRVNYLRKVTNLN